MALENETELLYLAAASPYGIAVRTDNIPLARQRLWRARWQDPSVAHVQIRVSPQEPGSMLWLTKGDLSKQMPRSLLPASIKDAE